jgi:hypothetical protein|tara:strand:- start:85 stop:1365 length:1281 start_codon:yes stop_codon:yes gene_type:complete
MKSLTVFVLLSFVSAWDGFAANPITNIRSHYLLVTQKRAVDRIYDLSDPTWNTSNDTGWNSVGGEGWNGKGLYNPNDGYIIFGKAQGQAGGYRTVLSDLLAGNPRSSNVDNGWMYDTRRMFLGGDGRTWGRYTGTLEFGDYDQVTNQFRSLNPFVLRDTWYNPGGSHHGQSYGRVFYNGALDGRKGGLYASWHGGGILLYDWVSDAPNAQWGPGRLTGHTTSNWTGFNFAVDRNGTAYGGPGDQPHLYKINLNVVGGDTLVGSVPNEPRGGARVIGNDSGDIEVNTEGTTLYLCGYILGGPINGKKWYGTMDVATGVYTPVADNANLPDALGAPDRCGKFTYIDLRGTGPAEPLAITAISRDGATGEMTITWNSIPDQAYLVESSIDLAVWLEVDGRVPSGGAFTNFTYVPDADHPVRFFLRVREL